MADSYVVVAGAAEYRKTAAYFFRRLRQIIAVEVEKASPVPGKIEVDESYFGGYRKGKRGRGAGGCQPLCQ
jgi:transposase